jgi:hypothetical protein
MTAPTQETLMQQLQQPVDEETFFGRHLPVLLENDPRAALTVLEHAERAKLSPPRVLTARIFAFIALREVKATYDTYRGYLEACRAAGGFGIEPPFQALELFFDQVNERGWAAEVHEIAAMGCNELFDRVVNSTEKAELHEVSVTLDTQLETAPASGPEVARACALKACVLTRLGQKTEALKFWKRAKAAAPEVADFWASNSLLA